ncbi:uncharacterized protein BX664DRAFT_325700 [Halteromyces radiatus]|uniref:uncharacterized protein n=1 Tax=Halteromyces radiatus TaxID=101107 RepID=UPI0022211D49|nr:uncharacterized protein BX664DRAFT_325700 [Halteromyces radiatus]KAI8097166.1 hypothetical protein BX664DRAFT_325700 [Halteromyces radiatus]
MVAIRNLYSQRTHLLVSHTQRSFFIKTLPIRRTYTTTTPLKGWRKYADQFKHKPASYLTTFAILHELTAIIPFPLVYYGLSWSSLKVPVPEQAVNEGNRIVNKVRVRYGFTPLEPDSRVMINLATTYAIVKIMLPLRIGASVAMTPYLAERLMGPLLSSISALFKKSKPSL